ncbi:MAG: hypothetical protein EZS28_041113, partial [Streblomastix strix]
PDIINLRNPDNVAYDSNTVRIVNMERKPNTARFHINSISKTNDAKFDKLDSIDLNQVLLKMLLDMVSSNEISVSPQHRKRISFVQATNRSALTYFSNEQYVVNYQDS